MEFRAREVRAMRTWDGNIEVTFALKKSSVKAFENGYAEICDLEDIAVEAKKHRNRRSLDANAYFHLLCNKIAAERMDGEDETKIRLNLEYGTLARGKDGGIAAVILPESVDARDFYDYFSPYGEKIMGGTKCIYYKAYKRTRDLDSKEMARLIEGTIREAQELGIDTATPEEQALMLKRWEEIKKREQGNAHRKVDRSTAEKADAERDDRYDIPPCGEQAV